MTCGPRTSQLVKLIFDPQTVKAEARPLAAASYALQQPTTSSKTCSRRTSRRYQTWSSQQISTLLLNTWRSLVWEKRGDLGDHFFTFLCLSGRIRLLNAQERPVSKELPEDIRRSHLGSFSRSRYQIIFSRCQPINLIHCRANVKS